MRQELVTACLWLHSLATVVLIGHYALLYLVYLPALGSSLEGVAVGQVLGAVTERARPWLILALLVFAATGGFLTLGDSQYLGIGNFGNVWSALMLVKHGTVVVLLGLAFYLDLLLRRGAAKGVQAHERSSALSGATALCGSLVLLLTAAAQVQ